jgi:hypothetical protein
LFARNFVKAMGCRVKPGNDSNEPIGRPACR